MLVDVRPLPKVCLLIVESLQSETEQEGQRILAGDASLHKYPVQGEKQ